MDKNSQEVIGLNPNMHLSVFQTYVRISTNTLAVWKNIGRKPYYSHDSVYVVLCYMVVKVRRQSHLMTQKE